MKKVICLLADGFEETEAIATIDVLRRAGLTVDLVSLNSSFYVTGSHKIKLTADRTWGPDLHDADLLFLPGGQPGSNHLAADPRVLGLVLDFNNQGKTIAAICAAPMVLAKAGVLQGKKATSYPSSKDVVVAGGADYREDFVVVDGNIITSRGVGTVMPFACTLVEALGIDSEPLKKSMLLEWTFEKN
jgi:4-methyl-5(b-hydroxyethyl)-thiazole monophosphate biosynthesis